MLRTILTVILVINCFALLGLILIQRGRGGGLAGVFGGGGVEQAFGTRATTLAQKATAVLAVIFLVLVAVLVWEYTPRRAAEPPGRTAPATSEGTPAGQTAPGATQPASGSPATSPTDNE